MSDITANIVVSAPSQLFTMPRSFKAIANGKIYIGQVDTDPVNPANQIQVYLENENGSHVPVAQPIIINAGGYPVYNGQIAKFVTVQGHSMAVYDAYGTQQFYYPNVLKYDPDQLRQDLSTSTGASLIGTSNGDTVQEAIDTITKNQFYNESDIALFGYDYSLPNVDAKQSIIDAIEKTGKAYISGNITLSRFDWPEGAKLEGKGTITYTRRPSVPCNLDSYTPVNHAKMKATWVYGVFDICDMLQLKTAGFNTIIHYGYNFTDGGTFEKACNAAEAVGINVIINSPNDVPHSSDVQLGSRDCVIGFYLFDEPQHQGVSVAAQNTRVNAWRAVTGKSLCIADNGIFGFGTQTISPDYDIIFVDSYYVAASTDVDNKMAAITSFAELDYKSNHAKLIPAVGLFTGDAFSNKEKQISFAKSFFRFGDGSYASFSWESSVADPTHIDIITDNDFYAQAKVFNNIFEQDPYQYKYYLWGPGLGLGGLIRNLNQAYTSNDVKPWSVLNTGAATDERHQAFSDSGLAFRNGGGIAALDIETMNSIAISIGYRDYATDSSTTVETFYTTDDYYTSTTMRSDILANNSGASACLETAENVAIGLKITPTTSNSNLFKFLSCSITTCSWEGNAF